MICIETQHFGLNRILLLAIGLWPYQRSKLARIQVILCFGTLISSIIFQLTAFMSAECTLDFIFKVFSDITLFTFYVIKYNSFLINVNNVRRLLEQLQHICNELKDENEITIIKEYGNSAKRYTVIFTSFAICLILGAILLPFWARIVNIVLHINESQSQHAIQLVPLYFVDPEKHFYLNFLYTDVVIYIGTTTIVAIGTMLLAYIQHACGMFMIARDLRGLYDRSTKIIFSYRFKQTMTFKMLENVSLRNEIMIRKIKYAVDIHQKAMNFCEFLLSTFEGSFTMLIGINVVSLSLHIFAMFRTATLGDKEECLLHLGAVTGIIMYMFVVNYVGQEITDHNSNVFSTVYNIQWYIAPIHTQKLILFMLQRDSKAFNWNLSGLYVASLKSFAMLIKASVSYFTVLYSTQQ